MWRVFIAWVTSLEVYKRKPPALSREWNTCVAEGRRRAATCCWVLTVHRHVGQPGTSARPPSPPCWPRRHVALQSAHPTDPSTPPFATEHLQHSKTSLAAKPQHTITKYGLAGSLLALSAVTTPTRPPRAHHYHQALQSLLNMCAASCACFTPDNTQTKPSQTTARLFSPKAAGTLQCFSFIKLTPLYRRRVEDRHKGTDFSRLCIQDTINTAVSI